MAIIGFHAAHEQIGPAQLLKDVRLAEQAGFEAALCSDHINPWSSAQGHSGFAWSWLGAALSTTGLRFGTVTAPGQRYHPAMIAQAAGTLAAMFPDRFWMALGSGENLNESITGEPWPPKADRQTRLEECADIIRRMLGGEQVSYRGLATVEKARLWDRPQHPPDLLAAAVSAHTAAHSHWADGLITINQPPKTLRDLLASYRDAGGRGRKVLQVHLCWAATDAEAWAIARDQWRANVYQPPVAWDLPTTEHFDSVAAHTTDEQLSSSALVSADPSQHAQWLHDLVELGFDELYLHHIGQTQEPFIDTFAEHVLPQLRS
jgi:probable non-F420 flavinoid oxidoreductase